MPSWWMAAADGSPPPRASGLTRYKAPIGAGAGNATEAVAQVLARDTYTWSGLFVRVITNTLNGNCVVRSRVGGINGNQTVTIGAGLTGTWTDDANSDALISGNLFNWYEDTTAAGAGSISITVVASVLTSANNSPILATGNDWINIAQGVTRWAAIGGRTATRNTEAPVQYTFRVAATLSNLRVYVMTNTGNFATTFTSRINGANGTLSVTIGAGLTGSFEDAVNSDAVAVADLVCTQVVTAAGAGNITPSIIQYKSASLGKQLVGCDGGSAFTLAFGTTRYQASEGRLIGVAAELSVQAAARVSWRGLNLFARVPVNTLDGATTVTVRRNGAASPITLSIGAGLTGAFEDTVNTQDFVAADLHDLELAAAGTAGSIDFIQTGFELDQPPTAPTGRMGNVPLLAMMTGM